MIRTIKKPLERRAEIINAARYLFMTQEYDKTSIQDVINHLGIAKGTIYHYFKSKEELLEAVIEDIVNTNIEQLKMITHESQGTALEKIQLVAQAGSIADDNQELLNPLHRPTNDVMHFRLLIATLVKMVPVYEELITQGCNEGVFQTDSPKQCAEFILFGIQFLTDLGVHPWTQEELRQRAIAFPQLIQRMLKAPKGSFDFLATQLKKNRGT